MIQTEVCAQCGFQIGSKWCTLCKDNYCDTCFDDQHLKGNLQTHQDHFEWTVDACEDCGVRAARSRTLIAFPMLIDFGRHSIKKLMRGRRRLSRSCVANAFSGGVT